LPNEVYARFYFYLDEWNVSSSGYASICGWRDVPAAVNFFLLYLATPNRNLRIAYRHGTTEYTATSATTLQMQRWYCIDLKYVKSSTDGEYRVYLDGVEVADISQTGKNAIYNATRFRTLRTAVIGTADRSAAFIYDCFVIADTPIGVEKPRVRLESEEIDNKGENWGTITFNGSQYTLPKELIVDEGEYQAEFEGTALTFVNWQVSGGVSVEKADENPVTVTVEDDGVLRAIFRLKVPDASFSRASFSESFSLRKLVKWTATLTPIHSGFGSVHRHRKLWSQSLYGWHIYDVSKAEVVAIAPEDVRDVLGITAADIPDDKIKKMLARARTVIELELGKQIRISTASKGEKEAIKILAAIYAICYLTGGSAVGLSFSLGDKSVSVLKDAPPLTVLQAELERILAKLKEEEPYVGMA
jgi:hypothetical protein